MDILNFIPYGEDNAISREELARLTGQHDRINRQKIHIARRYKPILSTKKGYYQPTEKDMPKVRKWIQSESNRAKSTFWALRAAKKFIKEES